MIKVSRSCEPGASDSGGRLSYSVIPINLWLDYTAEHQHKHNKSIINGSSLCYRHRHSTLAIKNLFPFDSEWDPRSLFLSNSSHLRSNFYKFLFLAYQCNESNNGCWSKKYEHLSLHQNERDFLASPRAFLSAQKQSLHGDHECRVRFNNGMTTLATLVTGYLWVRHRLTATLPTGRHWLVIY